jgi:hypothetical protein
LGRVLVGVVALSASSLSERGKRGTTALVNSGATESRRSTASGAREGASQP